MKTTILLIRHGETAWNLDHRLQGHSDIALNETGRRQAEALARALSTAALDAVIASDLQRAQQTALAVAGRHKLPVFSDKRLRERCFGGFEGLLHGEIRQRYPDQYAAWKARDIDAVMPRGERVAESFRQFYARSVTAILHWAQQYSGQTIAVVAHGGVLECLYRAAAGMALDSPREFLIKNASINRFSFADGKLCLIQWGNVEHLTGPVGDELA